MSNHLSQIRLALQKLNAYKLSVDFYHQEHDRVACSCKDKCYKSVTMYELPTEKYNHCFIHCMKGHGIVTYDNATLPQQCNQ